MSNKQAKMLRKAMRQTIDENFDGLKRAVIASIIAMPLRSRVKFAMKVIFKKL